jgi:hypothetical protein
LDPDHLNHHLDLIGMDPADPIIKLHNDFVHDPNNPSSNDHTSSPQMPIFHPSDLVGRTFLMEPQEDGQHFHACIVCALDNHDHEFMVAACTNPAHIKFLCSINNDMREEIILYNELLDYLSKQDEDEDTIILKFQCITGHEGPLSSNHPHYNGSHYNVMIKWETGEITSEPLAIIAKDDPVTCAIYAHDHDLLDEPGWKQFKCLAKHEKHFLWQVNQAKL